MRRSSPVTPEFDHGRPEHFQSRDSCMEIRVELPPLLARAAFLAQVEGHVFQTANARLVIDDVEVEIGCDPFSALLSQSATLHAGWRRWRLDLDLNVWSPRRCALGLSPRLRHFARAGDPLFEAGWEVLEGLGAAMCSWIQEPGPAVFETQTLPPLLGSAPTTAGRRSS